jgi:hypothetical protein
MKDEVLKEVDVLIMAESHGIDPNTKGLYGFYIDCISNQPAAQPAPVPVKWMEMVTVNLLRVGVNKHVARELAEHIYRHGIAQPAVSDALFRHAPEHPQYIEGWNDCRAEMLKGMKP